MVRQKGIILLELARNLSRNQQLGQALVLRSSEFRVTTKQKNRKKRRSD
jgi:hypothetical protein